MALLLGIVLAGPAPGTLFYTFLPWNGAGKARPPAFLHINPADVAVPPGYCIEPVVTGLTYPTGVVTDEYDRVDAYDHTLSGPMTLPGGATPGRTARSARRRFEPRRVRPRFVASVSQPGFNRLRFIVCAWRPRSRCG